MQVGGKRQDDDMATHSDFLPPQECQPCLQDSQHLVAEGYCTTCNEYLCLQCFKTHTKPKPSRHHILVDKTMLPNLKASHRDTISSTCTLHCLDHSSKLREFYCPSHDISACSVCVTLKHATCGVKYIPDLPNVNNYKQSEEYRQLLEDIERVQTNTATAINDVKETSQAIVSGMKAVIKMVQNEFQMTVQHYKEREKELLALCKRFEEEDYGELQSCYDDLISLQSTIDDAMSTLQSLEQESTNLYSESKRVNKLPLDFQDQLLNYYGRIKVPEYSFSPDETLQRCLQSNGGLGTLSRSYKTKRPFLLSIASKLPGIDTKSANDKEKALITGLVYLHPHTLLALDWNIKVLKSIDSTNNKITSELTLPDSPWDITLLPNDQGAITIPNQRKVQLITTKGKPKCSRSFSVSGLCLGIASIQPNIAVSFELPGKVEIMDLEGTVLTSITTDNFGKDLFMFPGYLTVLRESSGDVLFVSDYDTNNITKLTTQGKVVGSYKNPSWKCLAGVTCVGQKVLVCDRDGETVEVMDEDGSNISTLLNKKHGIKGPVAICYNESEETIFVSSAVHGGPISVFKLSNK